MRQETLAVCLSDEVRQETLSVYLSDEVRQETVTICLYHEVRQEGEHEGKKGSGRDRERDVVKEIENMKK